jgi:hypothetical protein
LLRLASYDIGIGVSSYKQYNIMKDGEVSLVGHDDTWLVDKLMSAVAKGAQTTQAVAGAPVREALAHTCNTRQQSIR